MNQIKIDPEFQSLIQPLKPEEYEQLEANILADGCMNALVLWDGTLIDGHNRYRICTEHDITYQTIDKHFDSREEAIIWICKNQSGRRNLTPEQMSYLIGIQYEAEKIKKAHNQYTKSARTQNDTEQNNSEKATRTRERLAIEHGVGCNTIIRNAQFARAVDTISETAPELKQEILSGRLNANKTDIVRLAEKPEDERTEMIAQVQSGVPVREALQASKPPQELKKPRLETKTCTKCGRVKPLADYEKGRNICYECRVQNMPRSDYSPKGELIQTTPEVAALMKEKGDDVFRSITDVNREITYGIDEFMMELQAVLDTCIRQTKDSIEEHPELMKEADNRKKIIAALLDTETAIHLIKESMDYE